MHLIHAFDECIFKEGGKSRSGRALHFTHYNFCRVHQTLRVTPAMEAGISDHLWSVEEVINLLETARIRDAA